MGKEWAGLLFPGERMGRPFHSFLGEKTDLGEIPACYNGISSAFTNDCLEWKLTTVDPQVRSTWRSGVRSAMRTANQLTGRGATYVDDAPAC